MNVIRRTASTIAAALVAYSSVVAIADSYVMEPAHTSVVFGVSHMGFSYTYGRFNQVTGGYTLDEQNPAASQFQMTIDASSIDTNDKKRDEHLRSPDFFNVKQFPTITFQSKSVTVEKKGEDTILNVVGDLTIHGVTRSVTLPLKVLKVGEGFGGDFRSGFVCQTALMRSEFGMTNMIPGVGDEITVIVSFEGVRESAAAPQ